MGFAEKNAPGQSTTPTGFVSLGNTEMVQEVIINKELSKRGLSIVPLRCLIPDASLYTAMILQPTGELEACPEYFRSRDEASAIRKQREFLELARSKNADLVITPEYSCPWLVMKTILQKKRMPGNGRLWVLGCESITPKELSKLRKGFRDVEWIVEDVQEGLSGYFLDPVCYVFWAKDITGSTRPVVAVQFKCHHSVSQSHFERDNLMTGSIRYVIQNDDLNSVRLVTLICSDSLHDDLDKETWAGDANGAYLILHLQLNHDPRQEAFRLYRHTAFLRNRERQEFICVNWARGFNIVGDPRGSSPFGGSAYYTKSGTLSLNDGDVNWNHAKGLYYARCKASDSHIYFFNYDEQVFLLRTTKPNQGGSYGVSQSEGRTGPKISDSYLWEGSKWIETDPDDGFLTLCGQTEFDLRPLSEATTSPLDKERLIALSNGVITEKRELMWCDPREMEFFRVESGEVVRRMTFVQDPDATACSERFRLLTNFGRLKNEIIANPENFPKCIGDLRDDCAMVYPIEAGVYDFNLRRQDGSARATVAFLGSCPAGRAKRVFDVMAQFLGDDKRRLVVWYELGGILRHICLESPPEIGETRTQDLRDYSSTKEV